jgi:signal transduction histidine kinase
VVINDLFQVVSLILPFVLARRAAMVWFVTGNVVTLMIYVVIQHTVVEPSPTTAAMVIEVLTPLGWRCVAFAVGIMLCGDRQRRKELASANEQLLAAQALLADRARLAERLDISRELHDSIGHHLAALNVQLELARHQTEGTARDTVVQAQAAGRRMLTEVRSIVTTWRDEASLEVGAALRRLAVEMREPAIIVDIESGLEVKDALPARALIRCAQEIVTNAIRHANARHVWLELATDRGGVRLVGRDDGCGRDVVELGNGLRGLTERAEALQGRVDVSSPSGGGFVVEMWVPA